MIGIVNFLTRNVPGMGRDGTGWDLNVVRYPASFPKLVSANMDSTTSTFFANPFKPRIEDKFLKIQDPLSDNEIHQFNSWASLLVETDESLSKQSSSSRSRRRRARHFARKVYSISVELFVLCSLSYHISTLPPIPSGPFYNQLEDWWKSCPPQESLSAVTIAICRNLPPYDPGSHDVAALTVSTPARLEKRNIDGFLKATPRIASSAGKDGSSFLWGFNF
ncbi:uncharacterized protein BDV17DRAFT_2410 [Aspergillus undulatus]|uniref:uncharacterized protein n=1 Tax=Aspergillus undulatus TaxID=1810928 RepID=UPI003CCD3882